MIALRLQDDARASRRVRPSVTAVALWGGPAATERVPYHRQHPRFLAPTVADVNVLLTSCPLLAAPLRRQARRLTGVGEAFQTSGAICPASTLTGLQTCTRSFPPAPEHFPVNCVDKDTARATRGTDMPVPETALIEFYLPMRFWDRGGSGSVGAGGVDRKTRIGYPFAGRDISHAITAS